MAESMDSAAPGPSAQSDAASCFLEGQWRGLTPRPRHWSDARSVDP